MKLRLNPPNQDLAFWYQVSPVTVCIEYLRNGSLQCIIDWDHISYSGQVVRPYRGQCHFVLE